MTDVESTNIDSSHDLLCDTTSKFDELQFRWYVGIEFILRLETLFFVCMFCSSLGCFVLRLDAYFCYKYLLHEVRQSRY